MFYRASQTFSGVNGTGQRLVMIFLTADACEEGVSNMLSKDARSDENRTAG